MIYIVGCLLLSVAYVIGNLHGQRIMLRDVQRTLREYEGQ